MIYNLKENNINNNVPNLEQKYRMAKLGAAFIVSEIDNMAEVSSYFKELYIMKVLAVDYLHLIDIDTDEMLTIGEFEDLSRSNIFNQLKKAKAPYKYVVLEDFKIFKRMLDTEVQNELARRNDLLIRLEKAVQLSVTPENLGQLAKTKDELLADLKKANG